MPNFSMMNSNVSAGINGSPADRILAANPWQTRRVGNGSGNRDSRQAGALKRTGNPWGVPVEDVENDLYVTNFTRMDGFQRMVWTTAHFDRNHWNPEEPMKSIEVFVANEYRGKNPNAQIRLINWDPPMTHYGHLELPRQLAAAHFSVVRWLVRP